LSSAANGSKRKKAVVATFLALRTIVATAVWLSVTSSALAEGDDARVSAAFVTGSAVAVVSLGLGAALVATEGSDGSKGAGVVIAQAGFTLAPVVAHGMLGEWRRGSLFAVAPAVGTLGMLALLEARPHTVAGGPSEYQYTFSGLFTLSVLSSMVGIFDVTTFRDRREHLEVAVSPSISPELVGIRIGGTL